MTTIRQAPNWVALSSPGHNRPLVPRVERAARQVRRAAGALQGALDLPFESLYGPERRGLGFTLEAHDVQRRSSWAVLGEWLVAVTAENRHMSLAEAHRWFWQGSGVQLGDVPDYAGPLQVMHPDELRALMPYLLDPLAAATRRDLLREQSSAGERLLRKSSGVYYTPGDVAYMMAQRVASAVDPSNSANQSWLDPACGTGVFLRAALTVSHDDSTARYRIYGVDLDPLAAEVAAFVLVSEDLALNRDNTPPWRRWHNFRRNLATGDSTLIDATSRHLSTTAIDDLSKPRDGEPLGIRGPWRLGDVFPETASTGFSRIVANPPYAPLNPGEAHTQIARLHPITGPKARQDMSPIFVELCTNLLGETGSFSAVLPLSIIASSREPFPSLREHLLAQNGALQLLSFDRAPDALFGDDIKTRNSIIHLDKSATRDISVSPLYRWTSRTREHALRQIPVTSVEGLENVPRIIPKIGQSWERELFAACGRHVEHLPEWIEYRRQSPLIDIACRLGEAHANIIALAPTAYNFLGVNREPHRTVTDGHDSGNRFAILGLFSEEAASAAYAILSSRLAFWLWHVTGDGFHVTSSLLGRIPVPARNDQMIGALARLGDQLWKEAVQAPLVSTNRGRRTVSYPTWSYSEAIDSIDEQLAKVVNVEFTADLKRWHDRLMIVDEGSARRTQIRRKLK